MQSKIIENDGFRILCIAEARGQLNKINTLAKLHRANIVIHTGNFGFFDKDSISKIHESYLRHIVEFTPLIKEEKKVEVSKLSRISNENSDETDLKLNDYVKGETLSELENFLSGEMKFEVPVYTIYGMIEDTSVINKFKLGVYKVENLHFIDESKIYEIVVSPSMTIQLFGIGGSMNITKLFFHGTYDESLANELTKLTIGNSKPSAANNNEAQNGFFVPASGDPGNVWITLLQIGRYVKNINSKLYSTNDESKTSKKTVKIFVSHSSPTKESLLEHLAIYSKADFTISNSLHFLYNSSYNELSICPNYEFFKNKFIDSKLQLIKIWKNVKSTIELMTSKEDNPNKAEFLELFEHALSCFDRIPISSSTLSPGSALLAKNEKESKTASSSSAKDKDSISKEKESIKNIIPLSLTRKTSLANDKNISKLQNDNYYSAFQNLWHFNLCDLDKGYLILNVVNDSFQQESFSSGFDFRYRTQDGDAKESEENSDEQNTSDDIEASEQNEDEDYDDDDRENKGNFKFRRSRGNGSHRSSPRGRGRGRGTSRVRARGK